MKLGNNRLQNKNELRGLMLIKRGRNLQALSNASTDHQKFHIPTKFELILVYTEPYYIKIETMETSYSQSTLETLPDEILLEVCKYLLCSDILYSFNGLNYRLTRMITQYRHHLSFHKTSISIFDYLCVNILPQIGSQIRSLVIDCCYSVLQDQLFIKYFGEQMSMVFPNLERISLVSFMHNQLVTFLNTLRDLNHLVEIRLCTPFPIERLQQPTLARSLMQANNHRFTTVFIDDHSSSLSFDDTDCYLNILQLHIKLKTFKDLFSLFATVPNVQYLDVIIEERDDIFEDVDDMKLSPLLYLTNFQLKSIIRVWNLRELTTLLNQLSTVQSLSLFLSTYDKHLIKGDIVLSSLSSTVLQFNYAIYFVSNTILDRDDTIVSSWPSSHPVAYFFDDKTLFIHTLLWLFPRLEFSSLVGKTMSCPTNNANGYDKQIEELYLKIDKNFTFGKALTLLSQCRRVRAIIVNVTGDGNVVKEEQFPASCFPKLSRLIQIWFYGSIPSDLKYVSFILNAAPNLCRLDLTFGHLLKLIEDQQVRRILGQRITSLCIFENEANSSLATINEEHVPIIASVFSRVRDMYVNITHLPCSVTKISNEDSFFQNLSMESSEQKKELISSLSSESMLLCLLIKFKEHKLVGLCIDGNFLETIKINTEQWLRDNTILCEQQFKADFDRELNRLLIWM